VNPAHLFLGTLADNNADMTAKGRGRVLRGENSVGARLSADAVLWARWARAYAGVAYPAIARAFGISPTGARMAVIGKHWSVLQRKPIALEHNALRGQRAVCGELQEMDEEREPDFDQWSGRV
jgi:hypothetical protein